MVRILPLQHFVLSIILFILLKNMEETMKCLKNTKTGNIIRVSDVQAHQMAGNQWKYVPKSEWKGILKETVETEVGHDQGGSYEVKTEKKSKKK